MTHKEQIAELRAMLTTMGASVVYHDDKIEAHDRQIAELIEEGKKLDVRIAELVRATEQTRRATEDLWRQWQAYINTLPKQ